MENQNIETMWWFFVIIPRFNSWYLKKTGNFNFVRNNSLIILKWSDQLMIGENQIWDAKRFPVNLFHLTKPMFYVENPLDIVPFWNTADDLVEKNVDIFRDFDRFMCYFLSIWSHDNPCIRNAITRSKNKSIICMDNIMFFRHLSDSWQCSSSFIFVKTSVRNNNMVPCYRFCIY